VFGMTVHKNPIEHPTSTAMPDPIVALIDTMLPILFGTAEARPSGRLRPLLVVWQHPKRRLRRFRIAAPTWLPSLRPNNTAVGCGL